MKVSIMTQFLKIWYFSLISLAHVWKAYWLPIPFFSRITLVLSSATWVLPASHLMLLTHMPPCSSLLLFFSLHSSPVISWQQHPRHILLLLHHHLCHLHLLPSHLRSQSLLLAILPRVILSASLCSSSRDTFSSPHHRCVAFTSFLMGSSLRINFLFKDLILILIERICAW